MSAKLNILVYSGPGAAPLSTNQALLTLRSLLEPAYSVSTVTPQAILREPWAPTCAALVLPGGADLGYCRSLDGEGTRIVADYVRRGGAYLGLCAGGYFGSGRCEFEVGGGRKDLEVVGRRELAFFPAACRGGAFRGFDYNSEAGVRAARLGVTGEEGEEAVVYWNGGGVFVDAEAMADKGVEVLARYLDPTDVDGGRAAIVHCRIGQGNVVLTGPHPEFNPHLLQRDPDVPNHAALIETMIRHDRSRLRLMKLCLARLGLVSADEPAPIPSPSELYWSALQPVDARELPLALKRQGNMDGEPPVLRDGGNEIRFWTMADPESGDEGAAPTWRRRGGRRGEDGAGEAGEAAVLGRPLDLVVCRDGWPSAAETARWDHGRYFESLRAFQTVDLASGQVVDPDDFCRWGSPLLYGDVVTSTNTILEKNTLLLSLAKTGTTFAAGAQIAGRGRGSNAWISPEGSLIFSIVIHHPARLAASRPVVFVQYIAAVAVAEAARMYGQGLGDGGEAGAAAELYEAVPVRLKWPNDIYALKPASDDQQQQQQPAWVKIGGILSSCSLSEDGFQIVLGIGINTNNARPTTSLSALVPAAAAAPAYRTERLLARIVTRLGVLYGRFLRDGFAGDLQARYYRYWLHTGQVVTVDEEVVASMSTSGYDGWGAGGGGGGSGRGGSSSSAWRGRVVGVTNDWGLLRVQEEGTGREWALQSDENSFDFWKGLVRRKI